MKIEPTAKTKIFQMIPWYLIFTGFLTVLKVFFNVDIPWVWVFAPVWVSAIISVGIILMSGIIVLIVKMIEDKEKKNG